MAPLEKLFRLEIEFRRRLRVDARGAAEVEGLHTSYALQSGYESLLRSLGTVTVPELRTLSHRLLLVSDLRDVVSARESLLWQAHLIKLFAGFGLKFFGFRQRICRFVVSQSPSV